MDEPWDGAWQEGKPHVGPLPVVVQFHHAERVTGLVKYPVHGRKVPGLDDVNQKMAR